MQESEESAKASGRVLTRWRMFFFSLYFQSIATRERVQEGYGCYIRVEPGPSHRERHEVSSLNHFVQICFSVRIQICRFTSIVRHPLWFILVYNKLSFAVSPLEPRRILKRVRGDAL